MTLYPEIQRKAQAEIDAVVGTDRLPSLSDLPHLPYVEAIVKEVFRCNQVLPLGVPHVLREDDVYNGYVLPKGTICLANIW
jgi:cytochrome P450